MKCAACELYEYTPEDMDAFQPPSLNHTCKKKGPKNKKDILKALGKAARRMYHSFDAGYNKEEVDALIWRLAGSPHISD